MGHETCSPGTLESLVEPRHFFSGVLFVVDFGVALEPGPRVIPQFRQHAASVIEGGLGERVDEVV